MAIKNQALTISFFAWDTGNSVGKTGDAANITMYVAIDGSANAVDDTSAAEVDSTNMQGVYTVDLTAAEMNGDHILVAGESTTADIVIVPISITTERGNLATVDTNVDSILTDTAEIGAAGAGLTDLGGMSTGMKAEVESEVDDALTSYDAPTYDELEGFTQLLARSDAAIETDRATLLTAINANEGSGAGDFSAQTDSLEAGQAEHDTTQSAISTHDGKLDTVDSNVDAILLDTGTDGVVLAADAITSAKIADDAIATEHIATGAISADSIAANAIGSSELATDAIGSDQIAANAIGASEIADGAIDAGAIATGAIDADAIAANAIGASEIATDAIGSAELAASAVTEIQSGLATSAALTTHDGKLDTVDGVVDAILVDTGTTLPAEHAALFTTALTEAYAADGSAATIAQLLYMTWSFLAERNVSDTTVTTKKLDGSTGSMTFTLNNATEPTQITRAT